MRVKTPALFVILALALAAALPGAWTGVAAGMPDEEMGDFADAFVTVPANPLPGDLPWLLRMIARENPPAPEADAPLSPLAEAAARFAGLIQTKGVYYEETSSIMGMKSKAEFWMKGDMFKKHDHLLDEVTIYDGQWYYKYSAKGKTGIRLPPDDPQAASDISLVRNYTLSLVANSPYTQQEDAKVGKFKCQVFYMDMEMMGMKGNWLYVDKDTGALVKNRYGEEKGGMSITLTKLKVGGLGEDDFKVPSKVKITGP